MYPISPIKLIIFIGPTASGKSELAVSLAKKFNGEIISADSRQIYRGMDIGSGKVPGKWQKTSVSLLRGRAVVILKFMYKNVAHHCIDLASPRSQFSVARYKKLAQKTICDVTARGKLPIICGGSMHWIDAVVFDQTLPEVKPQSKLRAKLEKQSAHILFKRLQKLDPARAKNIDSKNKRRLIRALEIILTTGKPVPQLNASALAGQAKRCFLNAYPLWLGTQLPQITLYKKIEKRLDQRLKSGMVKEVKNLHTISGLSWQRLETFGLEYKYISLYLQNKLTYDQMREQLLYAIKHYAKRQMTWWKRNKEILWLPPQISKAAPLVKKFLSQ